MNTKNYWKTILKNNLMRDPSYYSTDKLYKREHRNDFFTPKNLIVTIKTKHKHYTFGGPIYGGVINLYNDKIVATFVPPKFTGRQQHVIKWDKIIELDLKFLPK